VLDIDRDRQRISLGLKQTQEDPWQRIVDTYNVNDELAGKVTKVVTFGAFVEILDGVEGLVHISELAPHHVESPREVVHPGDEIRVRILEIDSERRRLSLSAKRVEDQILPLSRPGEEIAPAGEGEDAAVAEAEEITAEATAEVAASEPETGTAEDSASEAPEAEVAQDAPAAEVAPAEAEPETEASVETVPEAAEAETVEAPPEAEAAPEASAEPVEAPEAAAEPAAEPESAAEPAQD
jgi:small subunit ribosomal protein S1